MEIGDEVVDNLIGITALVSGIVLIIWKPAVLAVIALAGLGVLLYISVKEKQ